MSSGISGGMLGGVSAEVKEICLCFIGDSFVNGTGDPTYLGWTGRLCAASANRGQMVTYYNLGIRGETSVDIEQRWLQEVSGRLPSRFDRRLVFSFGVNDTTLENGKPRVPLATSLITSRRILSTAKVRYPVLLVGPPPISSAEQNKSIQELAEHFQDLCAELGVPFLNSFTYLQTSQSWGQGLVANGDGSHPDATGYAAWARWIWHSPIWIKFMLPA